MKEKLCFFFFFLCRVHKDRRERSELVVFEQNIRRRVGRSSVLMSQLVASSLDRAKVSKSSLLTYTNITVSTIWRLFAAGQTGTKWLLRRLRS